MKIRRVGSAILIDKAGRILLQQRDDVPHILQPGKIGLFGGHAEGAETLLECAFREISEEISYSLPLTDFKHLLRYEGADFEGPADVLDLELFVVRNVEVDRVRVTEGSLFIMHQYDFEQTRPRLTPMATMAMRRFLETLAFLSP